MRIITLHCDYIKFKATKKAMKEPGENAPKTETEVKESLVVLTAIEKGDSEIELRKMIEAVKKTAKDVGTVNVVLYPYAHLSPNLASPKQALDYLKSAEKSLAQGFKVTRAPFGYYKTFELKCKGHPLAELAKEFTPSGENVEDEVDIKTLVKKMEKVKMSTQKVPNGMKSNIEIGRDLDLYIVNEIVGQGLPLFTPKGATIKREIERFIIDEEIKRGYEHTSTPLMAKSDLYKVSGHWQHYKDSMFTMKVGKEDFALRPMTCPFQFILYKRKPRSYKDFPKKYAEVATLFRNEQSGELRGLTRVRQLTLADAHVICEPNQVEEEFTKILELINYAMEKLGVNDIWYRFSKWDPKNKNKYINNNNAWKSSQKLMKKILDKLKLKYKEAEGEAAFYGPKLDLQYNDVYGKEDTLLTVQLDFALPERYDMTYKDENNVFKRPMIIHRSSTGATERMISYLLEKTQGNLPLWLSPVQARIISFTDRNTNSAEKIKKQLQDSIPKLRIDSDFRSATVGEKVRDAEMLKIPYIITIGDKEEKSGGLAVRARGKKPVFDVNIEKFSEEVRGKIEKRT